MRRRIPLDMKTGTAIELSVMGNRDLELARWPIRYIQSIWWRRDWRVSGRVQIALCLYARCLLLDGIEHLIKARPIHWDASDELEGRTW